jgi:hypothetical protein
MPDCQRDEKFDNKLMPIKQMILDFDPEGSSLDRCLTVNKSGLTTMGQAMACADLRGDNPILEPAG